MYKTITIEETKGTMLLDTGFSTPHIMPAGTYDAQMWEQDGRMRVRITRCCGIFEFHQAL
jgi:hypothetical protein